MPMVIPVVIGAVATYAAAATGAAAFIAGSIGVSVITASVVAGVIGTIVSTVASIALSSVLQPKAAKAQPPTVEAQDRKQTIRGGVEARQVIYGRAMVGGVIVYAASSGDHQENLHLVVVLAGHPCAGIDKIILNNEEIDVATQMSGYEVTGGKFAGKALIRCWMGDQTEGDGILVSESPDGWGFDHVLAGCTYLAIRLTYDQDVFPQGLVNVSALVRGKNDIYDPRTGTLGYSTNWANCVLDYLQGEHGLGCTPDELDLPFFASAANLSDESVQLNAEATEFQPRYSINGAFSLDRAPIDIIEQLLSAGAGTLVYVQGMYRLHGGAYSSPTASLGPSDFAGDVELDTKTPKRQLFNSVRGTFIDPARNWQAGEFEPQTNSGYVAEDGGEQIWRDLQLSFTDSNYGSQRLARIALLTSRDSLRVKAPLRYAALRLAVWQMVAVTVPQFGWSAKPFRVESWTFEPASGQIIVSLREENAANYAWYFEDGAYTPASPDTTLVDPLSIPAITGLTVTPGTVLQPDGGILPVLDIAWIAAAHPFVTSHEVQWRLPDQQWVGQEVSMPTVNHAVRAIIAGADYEVRVRAIAGLVRGPWSSSSLATGARDTEAPATPTSFTAAGIIRGIALHWVNPTAADFNKVEIQEAASATGPWTKIGETASDFFIRSNLSPSTSAWYRIRAFDRSGNASGFTSAVQGTSSYLIASDIQAGILDVSKFAASIAAVELSFYSDFRDITPGVNLAFQTLDSRLYKRVGGVWQPMINAVDFDGELTADQIASVNAEAILGLITSVQISSLDAAKLSGTVAEARLASLAASKVTGTLSDSQIAAVAAAKVTGTLTNSQIADLAATKITGTLADAQIAAVAASKVTGTLTSSQIADLDASKLTGTVAEARLATIAASKVTGTLADSQLAAIAAAKVTGTLTNSQIADLAATKVTGTLTNSQIADLAATKITGQITTTQITDSGITTAKLAAGAVTAGGIAAGAVTTSKLSVGGGNVVWNANGKQTTAGWSFGTEGGATGMSASPAEVTWPTHALANQGGIGFYLTSPVNGARIVATWSQGMPVTAGQKVQVSALLKNFGGVSAARVQVQFNNAAGGYVGEVNGNDITAVNPSASNTLASFGYSSLLCAAPAGAASAILRITATMNGGATPFIIFVQTFLGLAPANATEVSAWEPGGVTDISGGQILSRTITADRIIADSITANEIAAGAITATELAAGAVIAGKIAAGTIVAGDIATDAITAAKILAGAVTTAKIAAGSITASKILIAPAGLVADPYFQDQSEWALDSGGWYFEAGGSGMSGMGVPSGVVLYDGSYSGSTRKNVYSSLRAGISAGQILRLRARCRAFSTNQITYVGLQFFDGTLSFLGFTGLSWAAGESPGAAGTVKTLLVTVPSTAVSWRLQICNDGGTAYTGTIIVSDIQLHPAVDSALVVDGAITATKLSAGSVTAEKLTIGAVGDNLVLNAGAEDGNTAHWAWCEGDGARTISSTTVDKYSGAACFALTGAVGTGYGCRAFPVEPGQTYAVRVAVKGSVSQTNYLYIRLNERTSAPSTGFVDVGSRTSYTELVNNGPIPNTWTVYELSYTAPAGIYWASLGIYCWIASSMTLYFDEVSVRRVVVSAEIKDGAINAAKILAGAVTTAKLAAGAVTAGEISAGAVTTAKLSVASSNLIWNPWFADIKGWTIESSGSPTISDSNALAAGNAWRLAPYGTLFLNSTPTMSSGQAITAGFEAQTVIAGQRYQASVLIQAQASTCHIQINFHDASGAFVSFATSASVTTNAGGGVLESQYTRATLLATAPAGATKAYFYVVVTGTGSANAWGMFAKPLFGPTVPNASEVGPWEPAGVTQISGGQIITRSIAADRIVADSITASEIAANAITASEIAADAVTAAKIQAGAIVAGKIAAGTIVAGDIAAGAVTTAKLSVGGGNVVWNANGKQTTAGWGFGTEGGATGISFSPAAVTWPTHALSNQGGIGFYLTSPMGGARIVASWSQGMPVTAGQKVQVSALLKNFNGVSASRVQVLFLDAGGGFVSEVNGNDVSAVNPTASNTLASFGYSSLLYAAPAGAATAILRVTATMNGSATPFIIFVQTFLGLAPANATEVAAWEPGGVTDISGGQIISRSIVADRLVAGTITTTEIAASTIVAGNIAAGTITGTQIAADTITATQIAANAITASEIAANAVTFGKVAAGAIRATELYSYEIRAYHLASETIITETLQVANLIVGTEKLYPGSVSSVVSAAANNVKLAGYSAPYDPLGAAYPYNALSMVDVWVTIPSGENGRVALHWDGNTSAVNALVTYTESGGGGGGGDGGGGGGAE